MDKLGELRRNTATKHELDRVVKVAKQCFAPHAPRFSERKYLHAVYALYQEWLEKNKARSRAARLAKLYKQRVRSDTHPIRVIIDCATPQPAKKTRSKWSLALRFAAHKKVPPSGLIKFLESTKNGGMAGCAENFAGLSDAEKRVGLLQAMAKPKKAVRKKSAAPSPGQGRQPVKTLEGADKGED